MLETALRLAAKVKAARQRLENLHIHRIDPDPMADAFVAARQDGLAAHEPDLRPVQHLAVLQSLLARHQIGDAVAYAQADLPWDIFSRLDDLRRLLLSLPPSEGDVPDFGQMRMDRPIHVIERPGARLTVLAFTDIRHHLGAPMRLVHPWFARLEANIVYVADLDWAYYLGPCPALGDTPERKAEALKAIVDGLGAPDCACFGPSGGGFGALLLGSRLGARRILTYAAPTVLRRTLPSLIRRVPSITELQTDRHSINLRALLSPEAEIRLVYGAGNGLDRIEAENLAGLPRVTLCPLAEETRHILVPAFAESGRFASDLDWLCGGHGGQSSRLDRQA